MSIFPFDVKHGSLLSDPVRGVQNMHPKTKELLEWLCGLCVKYGWAKPLVTDMGRTRSDMEALYLPGLLQELDHEGDVDPDSVLVAREKARSRFSWHTVPLVGGTPGPFRAFDLRDWVWSDDTRKAIIDEVRKKYGMAAEVLDHAIPGGARHLHMAIRDPKGKYADWL